MTNKTPEHVLSETDPGDDVQRRFRYQAAYAALISLNLLIDNSEFEEIFCEHHEDTLIKRKDETFVGVQVKTRTPGREPFKSNDTEIKNTLVRFLEHASNFPEYYSRFVIATNYAFWKGKTKNTQNLCYLLELARLAHEEDNQKIHRGLNTYIKNLIILFEERTRQQISKDFVLEVLYKVELQEDLPKFEDIETRIAREIPSHYFVGEAGFDHLLRASKALVHKMFDAGSLSHVDSKQMYFALLNNPSQERVNVIVDGKRITRSTIENILQEVIHSQTLLRTRRTVGVSDLPHGMRELELKMAKGKISVQSIFLIKDQKYSMERLLQEWSYKYNTKKANERFDHLRAVVGNECTEAYDLTYRNNETFGRKMLIEVRQRLRQRHNDEKQLFFDCEYEHLLGVAGILTEICDVWWSEQFDIPENKVV